MMLARWALAIFWIALYTRLWLEQPVPDSVPTAQGWVRVAPHYRYATAPPWPAVEWNVWEGWASQWMLQLLFYIIFLGLSRLTHKDLSKPRSSKPLAFVGLLLCAVLRGGGGVLLTVAITMSLRSLALNVSPRRATAICWVYVLVCMQLVNVYLVVDDSAELTRLEQMLPSLQSLPGLLRVAGPIPWATFRYDALRLISFAGDVISCRQAGLMDSPLQDLRTLLAYQLYPPLLCAGPVLTYKSFAQQLQEPLAWARRGGPRLQSLPGNAPTSFSRKQLASYIVGDVAPIVLLAWASLHVLYFPAWLGPETADAAWMAMPPWMLFAALHWTLQFEWLSLCAVWRVPRAVAGLDGIYVSENMTAGVLSPTSFVDVWRQWHASLNEWCVNYIYKPLGGRNRRSLSVLATFTFIAFWHDIRGLGDRPFWYVWAFLNAAFLTLETQAVAAMQGHISGSALAMVKAAPTVVLLMVANLPALMYGKAFAMLKHAFCNASWMWLVTLFGVLTLTGYVQAADAAVKKRGVK